MSISIDAASAITWDGEVIASTGALYIRLKSAAASAVPPELHIRQDAKVPNHVIATVMAAVQREGLTKVGLVGAERCF